MTMAMSTSRRVTLFITMPDLYIVVVYLQHAREGLMMTV
jgi:hypothetical protein